MNEAQATDSTQEIWVFRVGSLGDALVALPAVHRLRAMYPDARLVLLTNRGREHVVSAWDILRHSGVFAGCIRYQSGSLKDAARLLWLLRTRRPAKLFYLAPHRSIAQAKRDQFFFAHLGGIGEVHGLSGDATPVSPRPEISTGRTPRESLRLLRVMDPNARLEDVAPGALLQVPQTEREAAHALLAPLRAPATAPLVVMVPGSKMQSKRWPAERFIAVGHTLLEKDSSLVITMLGSQDEAALCEQVQQALGPRSLNLAGRTTLMQAAAILGRARLYVGNDTGTMHLAAAMGIPGVAIFSARDAEGKWEPFGDGYTILREKVPCAGCMLETCVDQDIRCLRQIPSERVSGAALRLLGAESPS